MSFPRYEQYKDSGVEWLGEVPEHWEVKPLKYLLSRNDGGVWGDDPTGEGDTLVLRSTEQTVDGRWKIDDPAYRHLGDSERESALLEFGDLLVTKSSGSSLHIGKTSLVDEAVDSLSCCYSNFMQRLRPNAKLHPKLAWHYLNNELARLQFDLLSTSTTGLANLNAGIIGQILIPIAHPKEQSAIAAFLDRETAKIDALVDEQRRLIELLKEKRQAVISHAVTKGLNPDAPMKDSGVEWLGEVPEHWEVVPNKSMMSRCKELVGEKWSTTSLLSLTKKGVILRDIESGDGKYPADFGTYQEVATNDIVFCLFDIDETPCTVGIAKHDGMITGAYTVLRSHADSSPEYITYFYLHIDSFKGLRPFYTGLRKVVRPPTFMSIKMPRPPYAEQTAIATFIDDKKDKIDRLVSEAESVIVLLQERRTALISAAVTGKIDVRNHAPTSEGVPA